jgi:hypothetical protein
MSLKRIDKLLNSNGGNPLEDLVHRAQNMDDLTVCLRAAIPEAGADAIVAANMRDDGELVVVCRSSAWAARLRFESERLIAAARGNGHGASSCRVRVGR